MKKKKKPQSNVEDKQNLHTQTNEAEMSDKKENKIPSLNSDRNACK